MSLHYERIQSRDPTAMRWFYVLHGAFGSSQNWRFFMRKLAQERPDCGFLLVDLRGHGQSQGRWALGGLDAAAADLLALESELDVSVAGVIGHSLGGKVALCYALKRATPLESVWLLDTQPGQTVARASAPIIKVQQLLQCLPTSFESRQAFVDAVRTRGIERSVAAWLATSVRRHPSGDYRVAFDLTAIDDLLKDHHVRDLWSELSSIPGVHVVMAADSWVWAPDDRARLQAMASAITTLQCHRIEASGHWLQVDAPEQLQALFVEAL